MKNNIPYVEETKIVNEDKLSKWVESLSMRKLQGLK